MVFTFDVTIRGPLAEPRVGIGIDDAQGVRIATIFTEMSASLPQVRNGGILRFRIETDPSNVAPGRLSVKVALADRGNDIETHESALRLVISDYSPFAKPPHAKPAGQLFLVPNLKVHEDVHKVPA